LEDETRFDERVSDLLSVTGLGKAENCHNLGRYVVQLSLARFDRLLAQELLVMLSDEVKSTALHQEFFTLELALHLDIIEALLFALIGHCIGALSTRATHDITSLHKKA